MKVLVADQEIFFARNLATFLEQQSGVPAVLVNNRAEVVRRVQEKDFTLLIIDQNLLAPGERKTLNMILQRRPDLKIILTATEKKGDFAGLENIILYLEKPFDLHRLVQAVQSVQKVNPESN